VPRIALVTLLSVVLPTMAMAVNWPRLAESWPDPATLGDLPGVMVSWPSSSPFTPADIGAGSEDDPPTTALGRLYLPPGTHPPRSVPAVVLLHGSGGILPSRELIYAPQLARIGVAALVVDSFGARRDRGIEFLERVLNIT
jgi:acetyl esterase/lipase